VDAAACGATPLSPQTYVACYAHGFQDPSGTSVPLALARTFNYAAVLFDLDHTAQAAWLQSNYGISPAFAGTGYSVKDSYNLLTQPMTAGQMLAKSISSEYILKNVPLAEAGCRCISVPPYQGRANDPLDPGFIQRYGGDGVCRSVQRLTAPPN
jgi:hypothetical protein